MGYEATVRSPKLFKKLDFHLAYSHQSVEGSGGVTGGLTDFSPPPDGFFFLDHDQRNTLSTGFSTAMLMENVVLGKLSLRFRVSGWRRTGPSSQLCYG